MSKIFNKKVYNKEYREKNKEKLIIYYKNNKEKLNERTKEYYQNNKEQLKEYHKEYNKNNRDKINEYQKKYHKNRKKTNINFRLISNLRSRIYGVVKGKNKSASTMKLIGIPNVEFLWKHLESQFDSNMTRENYGSYWHVDHIIPCASYDFICPVQQFICFNYINLRPMEGKENIRKGKKSVKEYNEYKKFIII